MRRRLRRFWRRHAGALGVLCGAALLCACLLYFGSGETMTLVPAPTPTIPPRTLTPEWEEIMRRLEEQKNRPKPTPTATPSPSPTPEITPMPEEVYEDMYSNVRGMDGKRLFDWEKVDYSVPPPGHSGREFDRYEGIWEADFTVDGRYIVYKGFVFCPVIRPQEELPEEYWGLTSNGYHLSWWLAYIDEHGEDIRAAFSDDEPVNGENLYRWIDDQSRKNGRYFLWGDWIVSTIYPPPGYSGEKFYTYEKEWIDFFDKNPDLLYID